jgi:hypothetical protein
MSYDHIQRAPLHWILYPFGILSLGSAWVSYEESATVSAVLVGAGTLFFLLGSMFMHLRVTDEGETLAVRYGPLPCFGTRIRYEDITSAKPARSSLIDGWGIHYIPGRGWTYNLWGFDCVELVVKGRKMRIGTNDAANLAQFLHSQLAEETDKLQER